MTELLLKLCRLNGVSGFEDAVCDFIKTEAKPYADEIVKDPVGNLMCLKKGAGGSRVMMVSAHMDEVGFIVKGINPDGTLRFAPVGGIVNKILPAIRVTVGDKAIPGVISVPPPHKSKDAVLTYSDLVIDIGAGNRAEAEGLTFPGDYAAFAGEPHFFGEGFLKAKALDDRLGCAVMLRLMRESFPCDIWYTFTVQEEISSGVITAANRIKPDAGIVIECTTAGDLPFIKGSMRTTEQGRGAAISTADARTLYNPGMVRRARELAHEAGIPWQDKTTVAGGTDAGAISQSNCGVPTLSVSAPGRYLHSPVSTVKWSDAESVEKIVRLFLKDFK